MLEIFQHFLRAPMTVFYAAGYTLFGLLLLAEAGYSGAAHKKLYAWTDTLANLAMYAGYFFINIFWVYGVFALYALMHRHRIAQIGVGGWHTGGGGRWWEWVVLFLLEDLCFYTFHRMNHKVRFLWASHVNHHSSDHFNLSVAFRQTWTPYLTVIFWLPLPLLGFDPLMVMTMQTLSLFYQVGLHTQLVPRLGPLEWVFNTPRHHRVHHATNPAYVDKNFGGILIVWDRLFGTFAKESEEDPVRYGIEPQLASHNPLVIAFHEWAAILRDLFRAKSIKDAVKSVV